jgi:hypothetical protein
LAGRRSYVYKGIQFPSCHFPFLSSLCNILYFSLPHLYLKPKTKSIYSYKRNNPPSLLSELYRYPPPIISLDKFSFTMPIRGLAPLYTSQSTSRPQKYPHPSHSSEDTRTSNNIVSLANANCQVLLQMASCFKCIENARISTQAANTNYIHELE